MSGSQTITVGDWTVRSAENCLERNGHATRIKPRAMDVLVYLTARAGDVVSMNELIESVWRGRVVGDGTVYQCIAQLRQALGENDDNGRYIETIPKRGYRLIADVTLPDSPSRNSAGNFSTHFQGRKFARATMVLAIAFLAGAALWKLTSALTGASGPQSLDRSVAVLPFENLSADTDDDYLASGIHNDLLTTLAKIGDLKVSSRTSVLRYAAEPASSHEIGADLGVAIILEGSVQQSGDSVRINVQLIEAATDQHLWAQVYDRDLDATSNFSIQTEIATSVAAALQAALSPEALARHSAAPTQRRRAYDYYMSGNEYLRRSNKRASILTAVQQYQFAVEEDPSFALAWAALGRAHVAMYENRYLDSTRERLALAKAALERASELAADAPEVHLAWGIYHEAGGDHERALDELARAGQHLPDDSRVHQARAAVFRTTGDFDNSLAAGARAIELDPFNIDLLWSQALTHLTKRNYTEAISYLDRILVLRPDDGNAFGYRSAMIPLFRDGDVRAVRAALEEPRIESMNPDERCFLGWISAIYANDFETALRYLDEQELDEHGRIFRYYYKESFYGATHLLAENSTLAEQYFRMARTKIEQALENFPERFARAHLLISLAEIYMGLGSFEEARETADRALAIIPTERNAVWGPIFQIEAIYKVLAGAGDHGDAIRRLDKYLSGPGQWSIEGLLPHPAFDPLREDARFEALVVKHRRKLAPSAALPAVGYADSTGSRSAQR